MTQDAPSDPPAGPGAGGPKPRRRRRRLVSRLSLVFLSLLAIGTIIVRSQYVRDRVARRLREEIASRLGLEAELHNVRFSWRRFAVVAEDVELRHPREGTFAHADTIEVAPAFTSFFSSSVKISRIVIDGGRVTLRFRGGRLVNGPVVQPSSQRTERLELPFGDLAVSDVAVHVEHDQLGTVDLPAVDVDLHNDTSTRRLLAGVFSQGGSISRARCFSGPVGRIEVRASLTTDLRSATVALARVEGQNFALRVRDAAMPLDFRGEARGSVEVSGALATMTCPVPGGPPLHGDVRLTATGVAMLENRAAAGAPPNIAVRSLEANGRLHAERVSFDLVKPDRVMHFGGPDFADVTFHGDLHGIQVDRLDARYASGAVTSPGAHPERPIRIRFGDEHVTLEGHADVAGLNFTDLMRVTTITNFTKVLWTIDAGLELHGELDRFAGPADPRHPGLAFDIDAETRDFAVLREFFNRPPQRAVIGVPRGRVRVNLSFDSEYVRLRNGRVDFGRSHADMDLIQLHMVIDSRTPDFVMEGVRSDRVFLEDIGQIADIPMRGEASFRVDGRGPYPDPIVLGEAHIRNFEFGGLPIGDIDTVQPWRYQNLRVDYPEMRGRQGQSTFSVRQGFLDFRRYGVHTGGHITSDNLHVADLYHMLELEGDPVFEPFSGRTMPRCGVGRITAAQAEPDPTCVSTVSGPGDDPRRPGAPPGTANGRVAVDLDFWLGRPGDDPGGVLTVDAVARDFVLRGYGETLTNVDAHLGYDWLVRSRGYRGARVRLDYARARVGGGTVELSGGSDLGGAVHMIARANNVSLNRLANLRGTGVAGNASGIVSIEGMPAAARITASANVQSLMAIQRNFGQVTIEAHSAPDGPLSADLHARPPRSRWDVAVSGLSGAAAASASMLVPWRSISWRDANGVVHPDFERDWMRSGVSGRAELTRTLDLLPLLPTSVVARLGRQAVASVRGRVEVENATLGDVRNADARVVVDELTAGAGDLRFSLTRGSTLAACVRDGTYWVEPRAAREPAVCAQIPARLRGRGSLAASMPPWTGGTQIDGPQGTRLFVSGGGSIAGRLDLGLRGEVDLARLARLVPGVTSARGVGQIEVAVGGSTSDPALNGTLALDGASVGMQILPDPINDIHLLVRLDQNRVLLERARAQFGASSIDLTNGRLDYHGRDIDRIVVPIVVRNLLVVPQPGIEIALDADNRLEWSTGDRLPVITGDISLLRVRYTRPINLIQDASGDVRASASDTREQPYNPDDDHVRFDVRLHAREAARISNNLLDAEVNLAENERPFRITGTDQRPGVLGVLTIPRGRVFFRNSDFDIQRGRVTFNDAERIAPEFNVEAFTEIRRGAGLADAYRNQWRVMLHAYGSTDRFQLDMSSDPQLSREDILLLLAFRMIRAELDQITSTGNVGAAGQGLAVEALATATGLDRTVGRTLQTIQGGLPVQLLDEFRVGSAYSPAQGRTVPQVTVGRRLLNDRLRLGATVATTERREVRVTADLRVGNNVSLQVNYDNVNDQGSDTLGNIGADVRFRLDFSPDGPGR